MAEANPLCKEFPRCQPQLLREILFHQFGAFSRTVPVMLHEFDLHVFRKNILFSASLKELCDRHCIACFVGYHGSAPEVCDIMRHVVALNERDGIVDIWFDEIFLLIVGEGFNRRIRNNIFGVGSPAGQLHFFFERKLLLCLRTGAEQQEQKCKNGQNLFFHC